MEFTWNLSDPKKIDSILKMEFPKDKETMHSFLGLINFLNWYSPQLAELCVPLWSLILKDAHYNITEEHRSAFAALKNEFRKTIVLPYFNKYKDTILQTDASKKGFGAVIIQDNNPVYYASCTLTSAERITRTSKENVWQLYGAWRSFITFSMGNTSHSKLTRSHLYPSFRNIWLMSLLEFNG